MRQVLLTPTALFLAGCASSQPPDVTVAPGQYAAAFDAAKSTLAGYRFELERVDARAGVITTRPKHTAGFATPWDREESSLAQAWEDLLNDQQRTVRITFEPTPASPEADLREAPGPVTAHVDVVLERLRRSGMRLEPTAVQLSTQYRDPELEARGLWPSYAVAFSQDPDFARQLASEIRRQLPAAPPPPPPAGAGGSR